MLILLIIPIKKPLPFHLIFQNVAGFWGLAIAVIYYLVFIHVDEIPFLKTPGHKLESIRYSEN